MRTILALLAVPLLVTPVAAESPEAYYLWATQQNQAVMKAAYARHAEAKARIGDRTVRGTRTIESSTITNRFGGGVGYSGLGGAGGYAGYSGTSAGGFGFHYGYGFGQPGNNASTAGTDTKTTYEKVWHDEAWYGGPVDVLNPFCPPER